MSNATSEPPRKPPNRRRRKLLAAGVTVLALLGVGLALTGTANAIGDGVPVLDNQYPFAVKLTFTGIPDGNGGTRDSACSGGLLTARWLLTAGHCNRTPDGTRVNYPVAAAITATLGCSAVPGPQCQTRSVVAVIQDPSRDLALFKLDAPVTRVPKLTLATQPPTPGTVLTVAGWGALNDVDPQPQNQLYSAALRLVGTDDTRLALLPFAPSPDSRPCLYDSGAPYFLATEPGTFTVYGVENTGPACLQGTGFEVAARTDNILDFVTKNIDYPG
ncbi:MAG: trypsin-like serine protease [Micromonosporaceae bacterium]|nr:trypsin-like serine protease [Micromonosporaceae bacterium]